MYSERYANTVRPRPIENTAVTEPFVGANATCFEPAQVHESSLCISSSLAASRTMSLTLSRERESIIVMSCRFYTSGSSAEASVRRMLPLCTVSWMEQLGSQLPIMVPSPIAQAM